ncbi:FAD-dependent oxidoreductase [Novosphingobium colocasiae]
MQHAPTHSALYHFGRGGTAVGISADRLFPGETYVGRYDFIVIGSGPSGRRAAIQAAKLGKSVLVIEGRLKVGGVSVHTGTIPSKTLRETALNLSGWRERGFYGRSYRVKKRRSAARTCRSGWARRWRTKWMCWSTNSCATAWRRWRASRASSICTGWWLLRPTAANWRWRGTGS